MDHCISLSDIIEHIKSNRCNILDFIIEYIIKDKDLHKIIEDEIGKDEPVDPIIQENGMILRIDFTRVEDPTQPNIFNLYLSGNGHVRIDWGDGTLQDVNLTNLIIPISHEYEDKKEYEITIYGQENNPDQEIYFGSGSGTSVTNKYLKEIVSWGDLRLVSLSGALNSTIDPLKVPDHLPKTVTVLSDLLHDSTVSDVENIGDWDTSNVTDMSWMFYRAVNFNGDISNWDTSNVTNMSSMFTGAENFDGDISNWNTSKVTNMSYMFLGATNFNLNLTNWNVSSVVYMTGIFANAVNFNGDISEWNTSNVIDMRSMFHGAENFNQSLERNGDIWNTSKVIDMSHMFEGAKNFDQDISSWNTCSVENMNFMFFWSRKVRPGSLFLEGPINFPNASSLFCNKFSNRI